MKSFCVIHFTSWKCNNYCSYVALIITNKNIFFSSKVCVPKWRKSCDSRCAVTAPARSRLFAAVAIVAQRMPLTCLLPLTRPMPTAWVPSSSRPQRTLPYRSPRLPHSTLFLLPLAPSRAPRPGEGAFPQRLKELEEEGSIPQPFTLALLFHILLLPPCRLPEDLRTPRIDLLRH